MRRIDFWGANRLVEAVLAEQNAAVAFLAADGRIVRSSIAFTGLAGTGHVVRFSEPTESDFQAALRNRRPLTAEARLETVETTPVVSISLTPLHHRTLAFMLRLADLRRWLTLQAELAHAQRLEAVGLLAAGIAHDFNNLLTVILGAADALAADVADTSRDDLAQIHGSAQRGTALVQKLLAFGRQQTLQPRVLYLNGAINQLASMLGRVLGSHITLTLDLEEPGRWVCIDPTQLDRVLINLACNAREAMPDGGTLTISTGRRVVLASETPEPESLPPGRYAVIDLRDTGAGILPEIVPRIFEPFFTTRRNAGGTGLGLSSVQGIIRQSGGTISVTSELGEGTCFRITLPREEAPPGVAPAHPALATAQMPAKAPTHTSPGRLLLVDDENSIRRFAARSLKQAGWHVLEAASGEEALELDLSGIDLVISDVMMPGMDGITLVELIRAQRPGLRAVLMSGYADAAQRQALQKRDIAFLAKPFAMRCLVDLAAAGRVCAPPDIATPPVAPAAAH